MSQAKNKVDWCLRKATKEKTETGKHRGLIQGKPDKEKALEYIAKAEHYLGASQLLKENYSDISVSTIFYCMYQSLLAIAAKFGYESRNQECTFALIHFLIENEKIDFDKTLLDKIASLETSQTEHDPTIVEIREQYQYGTTLSIDENLYSKLFTLAQEVLSKTKEIIEE